MYVIGDQQTAAPAHRNFNYKYPNGKNLHPDSELHKQLLARIMMDIQPSKQLMSSRYEDWRKIDRNLTAFIPKGPGDSLIEASDNRRPVTMVVPMTYAVRETLLTYFSQIFLSDIIFPYDGVGPEDTPGNILLQHDVQQQMLRGKAELALTTQWSDVLGYGMGLCCPTWRKEFGNKVVYEPTGYNNWRGRFTQTGERKTIRESLLWEGSDFHNVDVYNFFPDTRVPAHKYQRGSRISWVTTEDRLDLLAREEQGTESFFNCKYLDQFRGSSMLMVKEDGRRDFSGETSYRRDDDMDIVWSYHYLIPSEWGLSTDDKPQKWMFAIANDRVIIRSGSLNLNHNLFPASLALMDFDGHSVSPRGRLEIIYGLQMTADWIFSSRIMNVTKCLGDTYIYDPLRLNSNDMKKPGPKLVRTRRQWWGQGVKDTIMPIPSNDVTQNHFAMTAYISDLIERVSGAPSALQGYMDSGAPERRTAEEYSSTRSSAMSRINRSAKMIHITSMRDLAHMVAAHTIQFRSEDQYVKLTGDWERRLAEEYGLNTKGGHALVRPKDLNIDYDVSPLAGQVPGSDNADTMIKLFQAAIANPILSARMDIVRMYESLARRLGEKNIEEFRMQTKVLPDDQVQNMAEDNKLEALVDG